MFLFLALDKSGSQYINWNKENMKNIVVTVEYSMGHFTYILLNACWAKEEVKATMTI